MLLLPDDDSLEQHIKRANFLAYTQHHPDLRRHPLLYVIVGSWSMAVADQCATQNLPFQFNFKSNQHIRMAMTRDSESESSEFNFDTESESANDFESSSLN